MSVVTDAPPARFLYVHSRWADGATLTSALILGFALRFWHLGLASLWNDELFTRFYMETGLHFMWTDGFGIETTPPVYYTVLLGWTKLFGTSEVALRLPSVIASTLTIPLVGLLGRELGGRSAGLIAAFIFAVSPMELYYAQEARAYAFMLPPVTMILLGVARFLRAPDQWRPLVCYGAAAALAIYVHNTSVFIVAACGLTVAFVLLARRDRTGWLLSLRWAVVNAAVAMVCVPEFLAMLHQVDANRLSWMLPMTFWDVRSSLAVMIAGPAMSPLSLQTALTVLLMATLLLALADHRPNRRVIAVLVAVPAIDFALILAAGLHQPILVPRLLCWMWIPLSVLLACASAARSRMRVALVVATVLVLGVGLSFQLRQDATAKEPWSQFLERIGPRLDKADLIVTGPWTEPMGLAYYGVDTGKTSYWTENHPPTIENTTIQQILGVPDISRASLQNAIRDGRRVVLLQRSVESRYLALLDVPPPAGVITQRCWGMGDCLVAMYWGAVK